MPLRFVGGEQLQRGRGIGGLFRLLKSVFSPFVKTVGKSIIGVAKSSSGKKIMNVLKDQAIDSSMNLAAQAIRGNNLKATLNDELNDAKNNLSSTIDDIRKNRKRESKSQEGSGVKRRKLKSSKTTKLKRNSTTKKRLSLKSNKRIQSKRDFFNQ